MHWIKLQALCEEIARHLPGDWTLDSHTWTILLTRKDYFLRFVIDDKVNITAEIDLLSEDTKTKFFHTRHRDGCKIAEFLTRKLNLQTKRPGYMQGRGAS